MTCDICGGSGYIRIPRRTKLVVGGADILQIDFRSAYGEYTCPECKSGESVEHTHVRVIEAKMHFDTRYHDEEGYKDYLKQQAASAIGAELLKAGCIRFNFSDINPYLGQMVASAGIVSAEFVADLDERAKRKLPAVLDGIGDAATEKIRNWGSHYTGTDGPISKEMAIRFVLEAFREGKSHLRKPSQ